MAVRGRPRYQARSKPNIPSSQREQLADEYASSKFKDSWLKARQSTEACVPFKLSLHILCAGPAQPVLSWLLSQDTKSVLLRPAMPSHFVTLGFLFLLGFLATLILKNVNSFLAELRYKGYAYILARKNKEKKHT